MLAAAIFSLVDALALRMLLPDRLIRFVSLLAFPGNFGAALVNSLIFGGHNVTSRVREFVLSLPFNFLWYLLIFRIGAGIVRLIFSQNRTSH